MGSAREGFPNRGRKRDAQSSGLAWSTSLSAVRIPVYCNVVSWEQNSSYCFGAAIAGTFQSQLADSLRRCFNLFSLRVLSSCTISQIKQILGMLMAESGF